MFKVIALSAKGCIKCNEAKALLSGYDIEWADVHDDPRGNILANVFDVIYIPFFILIKENDVILEKSYLKVYKILEKDKDKQDQS